MQAAAAADDLGACRERLPAGQHHPVLAGGRGAAGAEPGPGKPVVIGAVAADQRATREAATARALAPVMSLCQPVTTPSRMRTTGKSGS